MPNPLVEITDLTKAYGPNVVVDHINLRIDEGEVFGFLGPNGAGKTTTILMLLGLAEPTSGEARINGYVTNIHPMEVKRMTGYLPENVGFYEDMSPVENLMYITRLNGIADKEAKPKIDEVLDTVGLKHVADVRVGTFSKGMKQRLGIADVLVKDPRLVILDEPTTGIDPAGVSQILELIKGMAANRRITVLLCSHLLHHVQKVSGRVGIISRGKIIAQGTIDDLGKQLTDGTQQVDLEDIYMKSFSEGVA